MEKLSEEKIYDEAGNRFKCDEGGYDLWSLEAFAEGAMLALKLHREGKAIPNENILKDGFIWAKTILLKEAELSTKG